MWQTYLNYHQRMGILPLKKREIATNAVSRQNCVCLWSSLSMRSFAIDAPCSPARALYATLVNHDKVLFSHHRILPHFVDVKEGNKLIYTGFINLSLVTFKQMWRKNATMKLSITFIKKNNDFRDRYVQSPPFQGTQQPSWWRSQSHFSCLRTWEIVNRNMGYWQAAHKIYILYISSLFMMTKFTRMTWSLGFL